MQSSWKGAEVSLAEAGSGANRQELAGLLENADDRYRCDDPAKSQGIEGGWGGDRRLEGPVDGETGDGGGDERSRDDRSEGRAPEVARFADAERGEPEERRSGRDKESGARADLRGGRGAEAALEHERYEPEGEEGREKVERGGGEVAISAQARLSAIPSGSAEHTP